MINEIIGGLAGAKKIAIIALGGMSGGIVSHIPQILDGQEIKMKPVMIRGFAGIVFAMYLSPFVADLLVRYGFHLTANSYGAVAFICGATGISFCMMIQILPELILRRYGK